MSKETHEHLSSLVDGEISRETSRFLVRRLGADDDLRATWTRYHLIRDCLRHQEGPFVSEDFTGRVRQAIRQEGAHSPTRRVAAGWLRSAAGMAIAASVALAAIIAVEPGGGMAPPGAQDIAADGEAQRFMSPQGIGPVPLSREVSLSGKSPAANRKMNSYLIRHYQAAGMQGGKGFVTFVPIVVAGTGSDRNRDPEPGEAESSAEQDESADRQ